MEFVGCVDLDTISLALMSKIRKLITFDSECKITWELVMIIQLLDEGEVKILANILYIICLNMYTNFTKRIVFASRVDFYFLTHLWPRKQPGPQDQKKCDNFAQRYQSQPIATITTFQSHCCWESRLTADEKPDS